MPLQGFSLFTEYVHPTRSSARYNASMKATTANGSVGFFGIAFALLAMFFLFVVVPVLLACQIAAWAHPMPATGIGSDEFMTVLDKRSALGWKIFLAMMALLGICLWCAA